jgi:hypothetical protein
MSDDAFDPEAATTSDSGRNASLIAKPFGAENRDRLLTLYFAERGSPTSTDAWKHVYRLLLWTDQTIGLAHCYESDKSQPGRPWYERSLAFHAWLSDELRCPASALGGEIDWMFRRAVADLTEAAVRQQDRRAALTERQRARYSARDMPLPGEDPELTQVMREVLGEAAAHAVSDDTWRQLVQRIRQHLGLENKRRNLVGEGFEDVLAAILGHLPSAERLRVSMRSLLHELPGFNRVRYGDKPNKVDVAIVDKDTGMRTLVTAKWSIRADREKQFTTDFNDYTGSESHRQPFRYVLVTNEFDPARLMRACESLASNAAMFASVVHINPDGLRAAYGPNAEESARRVLEYIDSGRLISLSNWIASLLPVSA